MLDPALTARLTSLATALIDQQAAEVIVPAAAPQPGFWFGGGNVVADPTDGSDALILVGRYRDAGDSRTGLGAGRRGWELALFRSADRGRSFERILGMSKEQLSVGDRQVLSIEGSAMRRSATGWELFVSTEKTGIAYPPGLESYLKPGTGVWTIERMEANSLDGLTTAPRVTILASDDPRFCHVKDPFVYEPVPGDLRLGFCTHPYSWSSSNTAYSTRRGDGEDFSPPVFEPFPRGFIWDVAMTRATAVVDVPRTGRFGGATPQVSLVFYDGGESLRNLDEHAAAVRRPRGYSCEELGGAGYCVDANLDGIQRLSVTAPLFVSPHGTGCSRYVDVVCLEEGWLATWQQAQEDGSQPLVRRFLPRTEIERILQ